MLYNSSASTMKNMGITGEVYAFEASCPLDL